MKPISTQLLLIILTSAIFLFGCVKVKNISYEGVDAGYVAVGIGADLSLHDGSYELVFRKKGDKEIDFKKRFFLLHHKPLFIPDTYSEYYNEDEKVWVALGSLEPGNYEIVAVRFEWRGYFQIFYTSRLGEYSIPFTIKPNETVYLGNFKAHNFSFKQDTLLGEKEAQGIYFEVSDRMTKEIELIKQNKQEINLGKVTNSTPKVKFVNKPE